MATRTAGMSRLTMMASTIVLPSDMHRSMRSHPDLSALLSSVIGAGANLATGNSVDGSFVDDLGDVAAQQAASVGSEIVSRQLGVQPTITVQPGLKLNILEPYR